ncbi:MAG: DNA adenine methylase [Treponema sp.]|jgi:DNA adenine methylase|nr:DNA adenine methylase [Treponema sp.]
MGKLLSRPILRYHGSKWRIAPWIISYIPKHKIYVELFGGGGAVLLQKPRSYSELYNDLDGEIANVFRVARDNGNELMEKLMLTPYSREEYITAYESTGDPVEWARRTILRSYMGFATNGSTKGHGKNTYPNTGFRGHRKDSGATPAHEWASYPECLSHITGRLKGVVIENRNALEIIPRYDNEKTVFYADPPYLPSVRDYGTDYRHEMSETDHIKLAEQLNLVKGSVLVSGYQSDLYNDLYKGWKRAEKKTYADRALPRTEVLWIKGVDPDLFDNYEEVI